MLAGPLGFSVVVFVICAIICIVTLMIRRCVVGGELGGSDCGRISTAIFFFGLWLVYVIMVILNAKGVESLQLNFGIDVTTPNRCNP